MDAIQVLYLKAALILAFALILTAGITALAWRSNMYFLGLAKAWLADLPSRLRALRDPELRRARAAAAEDDRRLECYLTLLGLLQRASARVRVTGRLLEKASAQAPDGLGTSRAERLHDRDLEERRGFCDAVAAYLSGLSDEDIASIARGASRAIYEGRVSPEEFASFLKDERVRIGAGSFFAEAHLTRLAARFPGGGRPPYRTA